MRAQVVGFFTPIYMRRYRGAAGYGARNATAFERITTTVVYRVTSTCTSLLISSHQHSFATGMVIETHGDTGF